MAITIANSQNILFTSEFGGDNNNGAIMDYDLTTGQLSTFKSLGGNFQYGYNVLINQGFTPVLYSCGLTLGQDGNYYGINEYASGIYNGVGEERGIFYRMNSTTQESEILYAFTGSGAFEVGNDYIQEAYNKELGFPVFTVVETSPGVFYGLAAKGGAYDLGGVWKFDMNTNTYSKIGEFDYNIIGHDPLCPMIIGPNNNLYGLLRKKGADEVGYVYRINTATNVLELIGDLDAGAGWAITSPMGNIVYVPGTNKLYGVKNHFSSGNYGGGVFSYDLGTNQTTNETFISQAQISILGSHPQGLVMADDGHMYFVCYDGGAHNYGTIVRYTPGVNTMVKMKDFQNSPRGSGFHTIGPKIYGVYDGPHIAGGIGYAKWSFDVSTYGLQNIIPVSDSYPGKMMKLFTAYDNGKIIGHFMNGGSYDAGSIFEYDISQGQSSVIQKNASPEGRSIIGELCKVNDSVLIGFTGMGGNGINTQHSELGNLIKLNIQTGNIEKLNGWSSVTQNDHTLKSARPVYATNGKLYYSFLYSGIQGTRFILSEYDFNTNSRNSLLFISGFFEDVITGPVEYNNRIITAWRDSIFVYDYNQQNFPIRKYSHNNSQYGNMKGNLILASDGRIYGTTKAIDATPTTGHDAVIYSLDVTNFDFQIEYTFDNVVRNTNTGLTELNGELWGSTNFGGTNNQGYLFSYNLSNGTFTNEHSYNAPVDGGGFEGDWTPINGKLYSTSYTGGQNGFGTLVEFDPSTSQLTVLENLTINNGRSFRGTPIEYDPPVLNSIVPSIGNQNDLISTTITGTNTHFTSSSIATLAFSGNPTEVIVGTVTNVNSSTSIEVDFDIPINASTGLWNLSIGTAKLDNAFTISQVYPALVNMDPYYAEPGETINSDIFSENTQWSTGATPVVYLSNHDNPIYVINAYNISVVYDELLNADFDIPINAFTGNYDLHVDNLTLQNGFTVLLPNVPVLHSITPDFEVQGNTVVCTIESFYTTYTQGGIPFINLGYSSNPNEIILGYDVTVINDTQLEVTFDIPFQSSTGLYNLTVDALVLNDAFTVIYSGAQLLTVNPDSASIGEFIPLEIVSTGTQFVQTGVSSVMMKYNLVPSETLSAISYYVVNDTIIEATFGFPANTSLGMWDVYVDNYFLINSFKITNVTQQIISITPDSAKQGDFETIYIYTTGTSFQQQQPNVSMNYHDDPSQIINAIDVYVVNDTLLEVEFGFPYSISAGSWDVNIDNITKENSFTVLLATGIITSEEDDEFLIYPNPFNEKLQIKSEVQLSILDIYNIYGEKVYTYEPQSNEFVINLNTIPNGVYIINAITEVDTIYTRKLIKK
ncbi:MAG: T9SS type A sorting domain-containing protein [Bacteroidota bacterium]